MRETRFIVSESGFDQCQIVDATSRQSTTIGAPTGGRQLNEREKVIRRHLFSAFGNEGAAAFDKCQSYEEVCALDNRMPTTGFKTPATTIDAPKPAAKQTTEQLRAARGAEYMKHFGEARGATWFAEGKSFDECVRIIGQEQIDREEAAKSPRQRFAEGLAKQFSAMLTKPPIENIKSKQRAVDFGDPLSESLSKFTASIKLPAKSAS